MLQQTWVPIVLSFIGGLIVVVPAFTSLLVLVIRAMSQIQQLWNVNMRQEGQIAKHEEQLNGSLDARIKAVVSEKREQ